MKSPQVLKRDNARHWAHRPAKKETLGEFARRNNLHEPGGPESYEAAARVFASALPHILNKEISPSDLDSIGLHVEESGVALEIRDTSTRSKDTNIEDIELSDDQINLTFGPSDADVYFHIHENTYHVTVGHERKFVVSRARVDDDKKQGVVPRKADKPKRLREEFLLSAARQLNDEQWTQLESAARVLLGGQSVAATPHLLPQLEDGIRLAAPRVAWGDRGLHPELRELNAGEFALAVYGRPPDVRLGMGFTKADLRKVDPSLYHAIQRLPPGQVPPELDLPSLEEWNYRQLHALWLDRLIEDPELHRWIKVAFGRVQRMELSRNN